MNIEKLKNRVWNVTFYGYREPRKYKGNQSVNVIATTLEEAVQKVSQKYKNPILISVNHQGEVDIID